MRKFLRQTLTIARRDFTAIVFTPTFLIFLLAPLLMLSFGAVGGLGAAQLAQGSDSRARIVALAEGEDARALEAADGRLRTLYRPGDAPAPLETRRPGPNPQAQARALFDSDRIEPVAVFHGPLARPTILHVGQGGRSAAYLAELAERALRDAGREPSSRATLTPVTRGVATASGRQSAGFGAVFVMFFLTLLLAGQSVGMLAEERGNKVIEILAAAVPLEAVFLGKLVGMFGVALSFVTFWALVASQAAALMPGGAAALSGLAPAIGMAGFIGLFIAYFTLAFLLFGAVFLGIGAQASTMREIQMLSLPITMFQVGMFALASAAASSPGSAIASAAAWFPFSSPFAMAARAATDGAVWPHVAAIGWQLGWLALTVIVAARLFRRGVLKSGSGGRRWFRRSTA